jgi:hypothetical protein
LHISNTITPSQYDSCTPSSCQSPASDLALRLFHTRRHQCCFRSFSLTATHQGSQDPHRSEGRDTCSSAVAKRSLFFSPSLIVRADKGWNLSLDTHHMPETIEREHQSRK